MADTQSPEQKQALWTRVGVFRVNEGTYPRLAGRPGFLVDGEAHGLVQAQEADFTKLIDKSGDASGQPRRGYPFCFYEWDDKMSIWPVPDREIEMIELDDR